MYSDKVLRPYRKNVLHRGLVRAALGLAEALLDKGPDYIRLQCSPDVMSCPICGEEAEIAYENGRVKNVAVLGHAKDCAWDAYEKAKAGAGF